MAEEKSPKHAMLDKMLASLTELGSDDTVRLEAILKEGLPVTDIPSGDDLQKLREQAARMAQVVIRDYGDKAVDRARFLEGRPAAGFFARLVRIEVEKAVAIPPRGAVGGDRPT